MTESWVALLQVDRTARQASFWSLTSLGVLDRTTLTLSPDVPTECGPSGKADIATLTRLESLPAILAQMERAGIDRFERILPEHAATDPMQRLMVAGPVRWHNASVALLDERDLQPRRVAAACTPDGWQSAGIPAGQRLKTAHHAPLPYVGDSDSALPSTSTRSGGKLG